MGVNFTQSQLDRSAAGKKRLAWHKRPENPDLGFYENYKAAGLITMSPLAQPIVFQITPIPAFRHTQGQMKMLHMDPAKLDKRGQKIRERIIRSEMYKKQLQILASAQNFSYPDSNFRITFYLPMPQSWSKKKKEEMSGQPHRQKPDGDNLQKLAQDALKGSDACVWDYRVTKFWCPEANARIEVSYQP